ncbi:MAG: N-acetylmuramoyl-L-alanine amidase [Bacillota bacterium]
MNLHKQLAINNACYKAGRIIKPQGLMIHSTGANNPNLRRYVQPDDGLLGKNLFGNHFNVDSPGGMHKCPHAFIGKLHDGSIATYQILPWNYEGWHCGAGPKGSGNKTYISVEICEDNLKDPVYFNKVYQEAVEFSAYICKEFGFTEREIICHSEGYALGIASNHADVMHWFPKHGESMDTFRAAVKEALAVPAPASKPPVASKPPAAAYTLKRLLKYDPNLLMRGDDAEELQRALKADGFNPGIIDGIFGKRTWRAVIEFQRKHKLVPDGMVGAKTAKALGWKWTGEK